MGWDDWRESETVGVLVAGRKYDFSDFTRGQVVAFSEAVGRIGEETGTSVVAIPADADLTDDSGPGDDEPAYCSGFIGIVVAEGGAYGPEEVPRETMLRALEAARSISADVWAKIDAEYTSLGGKYPGDEVALRLGCVGPLPMAFLAFGTVGAEDEGKGGKFVRGQDMEQTPHETGVHGIEIDSCSYDGSSAEAIDIGDEAHAAREREIPGGAYHLIARYD